MNRYDPKLQRNNRGMTGLKPSATYGIYLVMKKRVVFEREQADVAFARASKKSPRYVFYQDCDNAFIT